MESRNSLIEEILEDRRYSYGPPLQDTSKVAGMMTALGFRFKKNGEYRDIAPNDVPIIMMLIKISRQMYKHKDDNICDIHGWANCLEDIINEQQKIKETEVKEEEHKGRNGGENKFQTYPAPHIPRPTVQDQVEKA